MGLERIGTAVIKVIVDGKEMDFDIAKALTAASESPEVEAAGEDLGEKIEKKVGDGIKKGHASDDAWGKHGQSWEKIFDKLVPEVEDDADHLGEVMDGFMRGWRKHMKQGGFDTKEFGDRTGKTFGKGSRNDFLNFSGSFIGGTTSGVLGMARGLGRLVGKLPDAVTGMFDFVKQLRSGGDIAGDFGKQLGKGAESIGAFASKSGPAAAGIAIAIFGVLGPIAGLISGLAAAITALAASVAFALGAGLGVFAGLLPVAAAGVIAFIAAFKGIDPKKLANVIKPLKDDLKDIQKAMSKGLFSGIKDAVPDIEAAAKAFKPLAAGIGDAMGKAVSSFGEFTHSLPFRQFQTAIGTFLPVAIEKIGTIFENSFGIIGGLFRAAIPITTDFLNWIVKISDKFSTWVNSVEGQSTLKKFFEDGAESAKKIGKFIANVAEGIGKLFSAGKGTGDSIFDTLAEKAGDFADFIEEQSKNGNLAKWFEDGEEIIGKVGDVVMSLVDAFDALDTPENREFAANMLEGIAGLVEGIAKFVGVATNIMGPWVSMLGTIFGAILKFIGKIYEGFAWLYDKLFGHSIIPDIISGFQNFFKFFGKAFNFIKGILNRVGNWFKDLAQDIGKFIGKAVGWFVRFAGKLGDLPGKAKTIIGKVIDFFKSLPGKLWTGLSNAIGKVGQFVSRIRDFFGNAVSAAREKLGNIVDTVREKIGNLPGIVTNFATRMFNAGKDIGGKILEGLKAGLKAIGGVASDFANAIKNAINDMLNLPFTIHGPGPLPDFTIPAFYKGGVVGGPTIMQAGERGAEAIVPLTGSLRQVDPSVRALSAVARGSAGASVLQGGNGVEVGGITIITPTADPAAVAQETINRLVASTFFGG